MATKGSGSNSALIIGGGIAGRRPGIALRRAGTTPATSLDAAPWETRGNALLVKGNRVCSVNRARINLLTVYALHVDIQGASFDVSIERESVGPRWAAIPAPFETQGETST
jgi:hypothetical protein